MLESGRYIIYGAGAVGGVIGGGLAVGGHDVALIARGEHLAALQTDGLRLHTPGGSHTIPLTATDDPADLELSADDIVILAMKTQDTEPALDRLAATAPPQLPVVCAQNGVENEHRAIRRFANVYGMCVMLPATQMEPGVVVGEGSPVLGVLDVGRYPTGADATAERIATALSASGFRSEANPAIMRFKYAKLRMNTGNAMDAACGRIARGTAPARLAAEEALAVFEAAGIDVASRDEWVARREPFEAVEVDGRPRGGSSSWQSLAKGRGSIEADYLNGEIVQLGRRFGVPTPVNEVFQRLANDLARNGHPPGGMTVADVERLVEDAISTRRPGH